MNVLSLQSGVALGHVGNAGAVFALARLGHQVWRIDTVHFSNHPAHGSHRGRAADAGEIAELVAGLSDRGALARCDAILSGYVGTEAVAADVGRTVDAVRAANPSALYICDPAIGNDGGPFVPAGVAESVRSGLIPRADIVTPNAFELGFLTGEPVASIGDAVAAAHVLRRRGPGIVIATSAPAGSGETATLAVEDGGAWAVTTPRLEGPMHGAGDLLAALFSGRYLSGRDLPGALSAAVSSAFGVCRATGGAPDLALIEAQDEIVTPSRMFAAEPVPA